MDLYLHRLAIHSKKNAVSSAQHFVLQCSRLVVLVASWKEGQCCIPGLRLSRMKALFEIANEAGRYKSVGCF